MIGTARLLARNGERGGVAARALGRLLWEGYSLSVQAKRAALDLVCPPSEQRAILEGALQYSAGSEASPDRIFRVTAPVGIEPAFGYVVKGRLGVLEQSLPHSESARVRGMRHYFGGVPSLYSLLRSPDSVLELDSPSSIRHPYDYNYYHVVIDCIGAIALMEECGLLEVAVIGPGFAQSKPFDFLTSRGMVSAHGWVVQEHQWIRAKSSVTFATLSTESESFLRTLKFIEMFAPERRRVSSGIKLYLTRDTGNGRNLRNDAALRRALAGRGFTIVDPGALAWQEQIDLFRSASHVVGVHGAAFTNILFRAGDGLRVVEIQQPGGNEEYFGVLANALEFDRTVVAGTNANEEGNRATFEVDIDTVLAAVDR